MEYNGVKFEGIVATPCCGKSYLCDKYPDKFVDVDEERLKCKYIVPEDITREELENTKGQRTFQRRAKGEELIKMLYEKLDKARGEGKILIAAPHPEAIEYFIKNDIKFCFVYAAQDMREEVKRRLIARNNPISTVKENDDMFEEFYKSNLNENRAVCKYAFEKEEYLEDIIKKFGCQF